MLTLARIVGAGAGVIVEWTSAVVLPIFGIAGWLAPGALARRIGHGAGTG